MRRPVALIALLLAGCASMEPHYVRPESAVPASWPVGDPYLRQNEAALPTVTYKDIFQDRRLQALIEQALANNRDLMVAAANIAAAREQYRIQRAQQLPEIDASSGVTVTGSENGSGISKDYTAGVGMPSFELDLFGRIRSLTKAQLNLYLATEAGARATRLTLVGNVADAWLVYAADASLQQIAQSTADSAEKSVRLTRLRLEGGIAPRTDLRQAELILDQARADLADQRAALAQDINLLQLLVGAPIDKQLLPPSIDQALSTIAELPAGLSSYILLRRPDVVQAEFQLIAANAEIGAARAALFPRISLTGVAGFASTVLGSLFTGGAFGWTSALNADYPIFRAGAGKANVRLTEAQRQAAVAAYQLTIQTAFREVADALARRGTMNESLRALQAQQESAADNYRLFDARYRGGIDDFLTSLVAQRAYYLAQQQLVLTRLIAATNLVDLYVSLGGDSLYPPGSAALAPAK